jgi:hypothetical protein
MNQRADTPSEADVDPPRRSGVWVKLSPEVYDDLCRRAFKSDRTVHAMAVAILMKYRRATLDDTPHR